MILSGADAPPPPVSDRKAGAYRPLFFWRKENHIRQKELFFDILAAAEAFAWENKE